METHSVVMEINEPPVDDARTQPAVVVLAVAFALGMLGDGLLRATPWGLNFTMCTAGLALSAMWVARWIELERARSCAALLALAVLFAVGCTWRDSATLKALDVLAVILTLALAAWRTQGGSLMVAGVLGYVRGVGRVAAHTLFGGLGFSCRDTARIQLPSRSWQHMASVVIGGLLALPLMLVFGALLVSADAIFEGLVVHLIDVGFTTVVSHVLLTALLAWLADGYLRSLLLRPRPITPPRTSELGFSLGGIEIGIVLGCLNILFLAFIVVQFRYFFGGTAQVQVAPGLSYAVYARRGFFELVMVAALVLPLLLLADWLLRKETRRTACRILSGTLVAMLMVIMVSALQRMRLYQCEYGLTELRLYTTAFMGWLAVVFVWFTVTVLRGRRERFVFGALVAGAVAVVALHTVNPDALIVRVNVAHAQTGRTFDAHYATSLSADAAPALLEALPALPPLEQNRIVAALRKQWLDEADDWRNWNWARAEAKQLVMQHAAGEPAQRREFSKE